MRRMVGKTRCHSLVTGQAAQQVTQYVEQQSRLEFRNRLADGLMKLASRKALQPLLSRLLCSIPRNVIVSANFYGIFCDTTARTSFGRPRKGRR